MNVRGLLDYVQGGRRVHLFALFSNLDNNSQVQVQRRTRANVSICFRGGDLGDSPSVPSKSLGGADGVAYNRFPKNFRNVSCLHCSCFFGVDGRRGKTYLIRSL